MKKTADAPKKGAATAPATTPTVDPLTRVGFGDWFDRWPDLFARRWPESLRGMPFMESDFRMEQFVEEDGTVVVRGELPGLDPDEDVTITLDGDRLTIAAKREERSEEERDDGYHSEFHYGSFERSVRVPSGARADDVQATYTDGILEVRVPVDDSPDAVKKVPVVKKG